MPLMKVVQVAEDKLRRGTMTQDEFNEIVAADSRKRELEKEERAILGQTPTVDFVDFMVGGLAFTSSGALLVTDIIHHCVRKYDATGYQLDIFGSAGAGKGQFAAPQGVASNFDNENIVVADYGNHRVQLWSGSGRHIAQLGSFGNAEAEFSYPTAVAIIQSGLIAVTDRYNHRIQILDSSDSSLCFQRVLCPSLEAPFTPVSIAATSGNLVVTGNKRALLLSLDGEVLTTIGSEYLTAPWGVASSGGKHIVLSSHAEEGGKVHAEAQRLYVFREDGYFVREWSANAGLHLAVGPSGELAVSEHSGTTGSKIQLNYSFSQILRADKDMGTVCL